jgi:hypothetical protein
MHEEHAETQEEKQEEQRCGKRSFPGARIGRWFENRPYCDKLEDCEGENHSDAEERVDSFIGC